MEYFLLVKNEKKGPYTFDELGELPLTRTSLIWRKGLSDWEKLENIDELKSIKDNIPPTIPIMDLRKNKAPRNWLVESVVITSLLALPFGIIGIIESIRSEEAMKHGDYERALSYSKGSEVRLVHLIVDAAKKIVAASFIVIPYGLNLISLAVKDYPSQYGGLMISIVLMYSVIFYDRNKLLVSTQTELETAANIQETMLPHIFPPFPNKEEFTLYASMTPAKEVGGDFYDFFMIDSDHLGLVMADVSGKGVPAALVMTVSMASIRNQALAMQGGSPSAVLESVNNQICANEDMEMFVTAWLGIFTISTGELISANAGHEYPAYSKAGRPFELRKTKHGPPLGIYDGMQYSDETEQLGPGDVLFLYTDGLPEATNTSQKMFGEERMLQVLNANRTLEPEELLSKIHQAADSFVGEAERFDDLTMMAVSFRNGNKEI